MSVERAYSTAQVAELLSLSRDTVSMYCHQGLVPGAFQVGGGRGPWRIPESSIEALMRRHRAPVVDDPSRIQPRNSRARARRRRAA